MASIRLSQKVRDQIREEMRQMVLRARGDYSQKVKERTRLRGFSTPQAYCEAVYFACLEEEHVRLIHYMTEHVAGNTELADCFGGEGGQAVVHMDNSNHSVTLSCNPNLVGVTSRWSGPCVRYSNPYYLDLCEMAMWWDYPILEAKRLNYFLLDLFKLINTAGQLRREWPNIVNYLPDDTRDALGNTIAKGKSVCNAEGKAYIKLMDERMALNTFLPTVDRNERSFVSFSAR